MVKSDIKIEMQDISDMNKFVTPFGFFDQHKNPDILIEELDSKTISYDTKPTTVFHKDSKVESY